MTPERPTIHTADARQIFLGSELQEVLRLLARERPRRDVVLRILNSIAGILDCERIALLQLRKTGGFYVVCACDRDGESLSLPSEHVSHFAVKRAMDSGEPLFVEEARADRRYRCEVALEGKKMARSIAVFPMTGADGLVAGVYADHRFQVITRPADEEGLRAWLSLAELAVNLRRRFRAQRGRRGSPSSWGQATSISPIEESVHVSPRVVDPDEVMHVEDFHGFRSANPDLRDMFESIRNLASSDLPCLICGETGTGKSLLARAIHQASNRQEKSFEPLQCAALPETLIESELLGHVKGSFTGAEVDRDGILVQAHGGTLFLDEVGDMSEGLQRKLLRALDDGVVRPLGAKDSIQVDFRTISATRHSLEQLVDRGVFRRDLYFRLKGVAVEVSPLRERREDILALASWFLSKYADEKAAQPPELTRDAKIRLLDYSWPGNVRELENEMRRLVALGERKVDVSGLGIGPGQAFGLKGENVNVNEIRSLFDTVSSAERTAVVVALEAVGGNRSKAAERLSITRKSLYRRMKKYGLL